MLMPWTLPPHHMMAGACGSSTQEVEEEVEPFMVLLGYTESLWSVQVTSILSEKRGVINIPKVKYRMKEVAKNSNLEHFNSLRLS